MVERRGEDGMSKGRMGVEGREEGWSVKQKLLGID
jgi:hypothetical protein